MVKVFVCFKIDQIYKGLNEVQMKLAQMQSNMLKISTLQ